MTQTLNEKQFLKRFPAIAEGYEAFAKEQGVKTSDYEFHTAWVSQDGTLSAVSWYPVGFDFSFANRPQEYSWMNYEAGEGFHLIEE